jgi:hypothetical protein
MSEQGGSNEPSGGASGGVSGGVSIERIEAALARLGAEHEPPVGWENRVMAAVGAAPRRRWWWFAVPAAALAAAALALVVFPRPAPALALRVDVNHSARYRGDGQSAGDVARITVSGGKGARAIWVYHEEIHLVMRCPDSPACRVSDASTEVDLPLTSAGSYIVVALTDAGRLPHLVGSYDADVAAAKEAGLEVQERKLDVE